MDNIYEWLYDFYALPQLKVLEARQDGILDELTTRLPLSRHQRRCLLDTAENLRLQWGTEAFSLGIRFGMDIAVPRAIDEDCSWLLNFLPKLDNPVS